MTKDEERMLKLAAQHISRVKRIWPECEQRREHLALWAQWLLDFESTIKKDKTDGKD